MAWGPVHRWDSLNDWIGLDWLDFEYRVQMAVFFLIFTSKHRNLLAN